jgi:hypothetical protein
MAVDSPQALNPTTDPESSKLGDPTKDTKANSESK